MKWTLNQTFEFDGRKVKWDVMGEGYPVVMVHGTPWSSFNLRHLIYGLSGNYQVFFFDLFGYGASDKSEGDVSLGIQNKVLAALIDYWAIDKPIAVGHDFGGATVLRSHLLDNVVYEKMIVIDPVALSPWGSPFFKHVNKYEVAFAGVPDYIHKAIVEAYIKTAAYRQLEKETMQGIMNPWLSKEGKAAFYRPIAQADSKFTDQVQDLYHTLSMPVLILWGGKDEWIPVKKGYALNAIIPSSSLKIIPESGHLIIEEEPEQLLDAIKLFIEEQ